MCVSCMLRTCSPTRNGPQPSHSGTQGKSGPCVQSEPTGRAIIVIVIEKRNTELSGVRKNIKEKRAEKERVTSREREERAEKENEKDKERERERGGEGRGRGNGTTEERKKKKERRKPTLSLLPVCRFNTSPCVGSKRFRVYPQNARMW